MDSTNDIVIGAYFASFVSSIMLISRFVAFIEVDKTRLLNHVAKKNNSLSKTL